MDSDFLRLVRLRPTMMPGGPCASSVIILSLDPHLVDASVNFVDLGYLHSLCLHLLVAILHFRLRLSFPCSTLVVAK